ncbi:MAG: CPBP family intramembrane glutamic endopeptidase [Sediminicola sp.]|tara:strand:- start:39477 stop:40034 length:558 start_codon:yes stop_codon:yes gene_type:complete
MLKNLVKFVRSPKYRSYYNAPLALKIRIFLSLWAWNLFFGVLLVSTMGIVIQILDVDMGTHANEALLSKYPLWGIFLLVAVIAPVLEEILFRGPLIFFRKHKNFSYFFYASAVLFGMAHLFNFQEGSHLLYLAPLLVAPQIVMGLILGYIRIKLGLHWSILLHSAHNTVLFLPLLAVKALNLPLQ